MSSNDGKFVKGKSGNPSGRPKSANLRAWILDNLRNEDGTPFLDPTTGQPMARWEAAMQTLIGKASDPDDRDCIAAIELLLAYGFGRPTQKTDLSSSDGTMSPSGVMFYLPNNGRGPKQDDAEATENQAEETPGEGAVDDSAPKA